MKAKRLVGAIIVMVAIAGAFVARDSMTKAEVLNPGHEVYSQAQEAMTSIFNSIEVLEKDLERGIVKIAIENTSDYNFNNMMVHMEFVNKQREAYYVETAFVFEGLKSKEKREVVFDIQDMTMLTELDFFNFCMEGF